MVKGAEAKLPTGFGSGDNHCSLLRDVASSMKKLDTKRDSVGLKSQPKRAFRGQPLGLNSDQEVELNVGNDDLTKSVFQVLQIDETDVFSSATSNDTITLTGIIGVRDESTITTIEVTGLF
ncbi:hypothetical protein Tco_1576900 [Tanacetum coccineum]